MIRTSINIGGTRLSDNDFTSVVISQEIGHHHTFVINLRQDPKQGILPDKAKAWIGQPIIIGFAEKTDLELMLSPVPDSFKGVVTSVGLSRQRGTGMLIVKGESPTIILDDGANTRSFTDKGLQEIVDEVIGPYSDGFPQSPNINPISFTDSKPYCVQYKESNFAFINRLANRYGEWCYYNGLDFFFGEREEEDFIELDFGANGLNYFDLSVKALPANFEMRGYDYLEHKGLSEVAPEKAETNDLGTQVLDIAKQKLFPSTPSVSLQTALEEGEFENIVERREQIALDEMVLLNGSGSNPKLKLGAAIEIKDTTIGESYGKYIIINITHSIGQGGAYENSFTAMPKEVSVPPLHNIPNPPVCETQLAKVTNTADEGSLGRVKVKFLWQEGTEEESPWIRVASPYSGKDKGFYIIPEKDDQVLVAFENNNPDKPYVLSGMYNGDAKPEWFDPKNIYKGFKSKGKNQWRFNDKNKSIWMHAPSAITMSAGKTITIKTGGKDDSSINLDVGEGTVNIVAKNINLEASELINVISQKEANFVGVETAVVYSDSDAAVISASKTTVKSDLDLSIEGVNVKINGSMNVDISAGLL